MLLFVIFLSISIVTGIAQILSSTRQLKIRDEILQRDKTTRAGYFFYICTFILMFLPPIQNKLQESIQKDDQNLRDSLQKTDYRKSIKEIGEKYDSSYKIIIDTLAKYGYHVDSTNGQLRLLIEENNNKIQPPIVNLDGNTPIIMTRRNDSCFFELDFRSYQAASKNILVDIYVVSQSNDGQLAYILKSRKINNNIVVPQNNIVGRTISFPAPDHFFNSTKNFYFVLKGSYKSLNNKTTQIDEIFQYAVNSSTPSIVVGYLGNRILKEVARYEKIN